MGCLESCFKKDNEEPDERTSLLHNETRQADHSIPINHPQAAQEEGSPVGSISRSLEDEQSQLNEILSKYSSDVIDVTALDTRIDAIEYMNRVTLYNRKLAALGGRLDVPKPTLRSACNNPVALLSGPKPSLSEIIMISEVSDSIDMAMGDVKVTKKRDLSISLAQK